MYFLKLELSTTYRISDPAEDAVVKIFSIGFDKMQLGAAHQKADLDKIKSLKRDFGLDFSMHAPFPNPQKVSVDPVKPSQTKKIMFESIENAHFLGADPIVFHPGSFDEEMEDMGLYYNVLEELCDKASDYGITLAVENKPSTSKFGYKAEDLLQIVKGVEAKNIGVCFDTAHARSLFENEGGVLKYFDKIKDYIKAVHLVDVRSEKAKHIPPEPGNKVMDSLISSFSDLGYNGPLTFEVFNQPESKIIDSYHYVKRLIAENM